MNTAIPFMAIISLLMGALSKLTQLHVRASFITQKHLLILGVNIRTDLPPRTDVELVHIKTYEGNPK